MWTDAASCTARQFLGHGSRDWARPTPAAAWLFPGSGLLHERVTSGPVSLRPVAGHSWPACHPQGLNPLRTRVPAELPGSMYQHRE